MSKGHTYGAVADGEPYELQHAHPGRVVRVGAHGKEAVGRSAEGDGRGVREGLTEEKERREMRRRVHRQRVQQGQQQRKSHPAQGR